MAGRGRPSSYDPKYVEQVRHLCRLAATDAEIADFFDVDIATIKRWKVQFPDFCAALKEAKTEADERVERSLYQRAVGYSYDAVKIFMPAGAEEPVYAPYREHHPPDTTAAIFWLKNRQPGRWRDRQEVNLDGHIAVEMADDRDVAKALAIVIEELKSRRIEGEVVDIVEDKT